MNFQNEFDLTYSVFHFRVSEVVKQELQIIINIFLKEFSNFDKE